MLHMLRKDLEAAIVDALWCLQTPSDFDVKTTLTLLRQALDAAVNASHDEALVLNEIRDANTRNAERARAAWAAKPLVEKHDELIALVVKLVNECAASLGFHCLLKMEGYQLVGPRKNWKVEIRSAHTYQSGKREGARIIVHSAYYGNEGRATFPIKDDGSFNAPGVARRLLNNLGLLEEVA